MARQTISATRSRSSSINKSRENSPRTCLSPVALRSKGTSSAFNKILSVSKGRRTITRKWTILYHYSVFKGRGWKGSIIFVQVCAYSALQGDPDFTDPSNSATGRATLAPSNTSTLRSFERIVISVRVISSSPGYPGVVCILRLLERSMQTMITVATSMSRKANIPLTIRAIVLVEMPSVAMQVVFLARHCSQKESQHLVTHDAFDWQVSWRSRTPALRWHRVGVEVQWLKCGEELAVSQHYPTRH